jgi:hypothetical protein
MQKAIKKMNSKLKKSLDKKQTIKAVQALKKYAESLKQENLKKKLLEEEDDLIQVTFTLTELPENPTPRPL